MLPIAGYEIESVLHRSQQRCVLRAVRRSDGAAVVIKTLSADHPEPRAAAGLRHEFDVLERLREVDGVIRAHGLQPYGHGNVALVLEPFGQSLATRLASLPRGRLPLAEVLDIGVAVAQTLARVHALDVVHKNIEPRSLLVGEAGATRLIDFGIASELSRERQQNVLSLGAAGALPYLSPEQTGRMNRELDYRSDFYSLGVTLFELMTGELPYHARTPLEWVHSHIGRAPRSPGEVDASIPGAVSDIVLKLLSKNAEDRYQGSASLVADLDRCRRELRHTGRVAPFAPGQRDVSRRFNIPQKLYGRDAELAALQGLFRQVLAGGLEFCMVSGTSGVGKSALVNEVSRTLVREGGILVQGKFDQFHRSTPYSAVTVAFSGLAQQLLAEPRERREALRDALLAALAPNARVLVDFVPDLEAVIGPQPPVPELPRAEAQNRFQIAFLAFMRVLASQRPLVMFLDDLQFGDASTLNLIRWLASARDLGHLLVIGAYRSNEVDPGHPLRQALNEIGNLRTVHELALRPLGADSVEQIVADTLASEPEAARPLAALLHDKVQGNPFFLTEMLQTLEQSGAIAFEMEAARWTWNMDAVRHAALGADVVEFIVGNMRRLPPATQRALELAACIGNTFDLRTLAIIHERSMAQAGQDLLPALRRHMIAPLDDDYRLFAGHADGASVATANPRYRFQHDRVQQAAYALIDAGRRQAVHLSVGRLMQRHADAREREEQLIDIVGHLNEGRRLLQDAGERRELAALNLAAGLRAQRSSAYETALGYLRIGHELLPPDAWESDFDLAMALAVETQQCAYQTARHDEADVWIERMLAHAPSQVAKAEILSMRTRQYATTGRMAESIDAAIAGLALLGIRFTARPGRRAIRREMAEVERNLAGRPIASLVDSPPLSDPGLMVAIRLLMEIFPASFLSGSGDLFPFLVLKSVNISLAGGNSPESAFAFAAYGMILCGVLDDAALGQQFGELALAMNDRLDDIALKSRVIYLYAMFIHHWSHHWSTMTPWFRKGIEAGFQSGDLLYLAYSAQDCIIWDPRLDLETAMREHADYLNVVRDCAYQDSLDSGTLFLQMQRNFLGLTDGLCSLSDSVFDERRCVRGMRERRFMTGVANFHIYKVEICHFYGRHDEAWEHVLAQDALMASAMSLPQLVRYEIASFLTRCARYAGLDAQEQVQTRRRLNADSRRMARRAAHCPDNFAHLHLTMRAELARLDGRVAAALALYEDAAEAARTSGFLRDEAMANELAARHLLAAGRERAAEGYLRAARRLYERWRAWRKIDQLDLEFPQLRTQATVPAPAADAARPESAGTFDLSTLDLASVMKASQAISSEIVLERLWATTMRIMLENAGGQRGCFIVQDDGRLVVEGRSEIGLEQPPAGDKATDGLPMSIVYHVLHTNRPVVINDLAQAGQFARDDYLERHRPQSLVCIPLRRHGRFEGAIYMENRLAAGVFTEARIEVMRLLSAQVSISIENARLHEDQRRLIQAQRRFVPSQFLESLAHRDIGRVDLGENVAKEMSVMFADLRGFTPLAERLGPTVTIALLNRFFGDMEPAITQAGGFIDSFAGDEIKALFDSSADAAVRAGIAMWQALEEMNRRSVALGQPQLQMGVGVNTGPLVLGTVGAQGRLQCSVIGDTVNLASRIEQLTKVYRARLIVGEHTVRALSPGHGFSLRRVDRVAVKGKDIAVDVYEVLDAETPERRAAKAATHAALDAAMRRYFAREFEPAQAAFAALAAADPQDAVPAMFVERCARHLRSPPSPDWQGFERLTTLSS